MTIEEADLCPFCVELVEAVAATSDTKLAISANPLTYEQLLSSADTCRLCQEFASGWSTATQFQLEHARQSLAGQAIRIDSPVSSHAVVEPGVPWKHLHAQIHSPARGVNYLQRSTMAIYSSQTPEPDTLSQLPAGLPTEFLLAEKARAIGRWLNECRNGSQHSSCRPEPFLPSRLISVGLDGQPPRLVAAKDGSFSSGGVEYATLSHCWGGMVPLRTTRSNLSQHLTEIPPNTIPPTFAEAMQIARDIKIPYMWIDSLCIVQDDLQDWQAEASQMDKIYGGSQLTVAAAQSQTSQDGCFLSHKWPVEESVFRPRGSDVVVRHCFDDFRLRPVQNVLGTRAWTLQEHMLSPRLVSCQQPEMHWQCRTVHKGESGLSFSLELDEGQMSQNFPRTLPKLSRGLRIAWTVVVENYMARKITSEGDRIPAFLGVLRRFASLMEDEPVLGLWPKMLGPSMSWIRTKENKHQSSNPFDPTLPSWTWLTCLTEPTFPVGGLDMTSHVKLLDFDVQWTGTPYASPLQSAYIVVEGSVVDLDIGLSKTTRGLPNHPMTFDAHVPGSDTLVSCFGQFDKGDIRESATYPCLILWISNTVRYGLLILEPAGLPGRYRRLGFVASSRQTPTFDLSTSKTTTMVLV